MDTNNFNNQQNVNLNMQTESIPNIQQIANPNADLNTIAAMLQDIQENEKKQTKYAKRRSIMSFVVSIFSIALIVLIGFYVLKTMPEVNKIVNKTETTIDDVSDMLVDASSAIKNLNNISKDLSKVDMDELFTNVSEAVKKLESIDFEGLNTAIGDLGAVIAPLARFFK